MLKMMRHHAKYFYVLFFIVILSFIFWGVGTVDKTSQGTFVAEVEKYKITGEEYWRTYDNAFKFYRDLYKEKFDEEAQKKLNLKENVLNSLIDNRVLMIIAKKNNITVSDEELNEAIKKEPAFMKDGAFDESVYQNRLRLARLSPEAFEASKRDELTITKVRHMIALTAEVPDDLKNISADEQTLKSIKKSLMQGAQDRAVKAYVEAFKKELKIKVHRDLLT